jgi:16S rRNA (cytidine1402-2'-O)-methyltransferase
MGKLYLVPTPIGNLEDMTLRAIRILKEADLILTEDTRTSSVLLKHYGITTPARSYHKFNEHQVAGQIMDLLGQDKTLALITDAGTPAISDPGFLLVRECLRNAIPVECLPGATAFVPALAVSGLPVESFVFEGFLPQKKGRNKRLTSLAEERRTLVFYESPYRLVKTLEQLAQVLGGDRPVSVSRELSKLHEETVRGSLSAVTEHFKTVKPRGEFVIIVAGKEYNQSL